LRVDSVVRERTMAANNDPARARPGDPPGEVTRLDQTARNDKNMRGADESVRIDHIGFAEETEIPVVPVQPFVRPHVLQQVRGPLSPQIIELHGDSLCVGRSPDADIKIPSPALSRTHMRLDKFQGGYRAIDLDSSNGIYLNEVRIHTAVLRDGDTLQLGNAVFIYHEGN
jgi:hypothetical protein